MAALTLLSVHSCLLPLSAALLSGQQTWRCLQNSGVCMAGVVVALAHFLMSAWVLFPCLSCTFLGTSRSSGPATALLSTPVHSQTLHRAPSSILAHCTGQLWSGIPYFHCTFPFMVQAEVAMLSAPSGASQLRVIES